MKIKNKSWDVAILLQIMRKKWSMLLKKMGILNEKSQRKSTDQGVLWIITQKIRTKQPRNKWAIIRDVRKSGKSVSQIQLLGDISVSRWTIWRTLKNCPNVEDSKGQKAP